MGLIKEAGKKNNLFFAGKSFKKIRAKIYKTAKRNFLSKYSRFSFLTRSFASRFLLRYAQPVPRQFKLTTNWSLYSQGLTVGYKIFGRNSFCKNLAFWNLESNRQKSKKSPNHVKFEMIKLNRKFFFEIISKSSLFYLHFFLFPYLFSRTEKSFSLVNPFSVCNLLTWTQLNTFSEFGILGKSVKFRSCSSEFEEMPNEHARVCVCLIAWSSICVPKRAPLRTYIWIQKIERQAPVNR